MARAQAAETKGGDTTGTTGTALAVAELDPKSGSTRVKLPRFTPRKSRKGLSEPDSLRNEDAWLDSLEESPQETGLRGLRIRMVDSLGVTGRWMADAWGFLATSIGKLLVMMIVLTAMLLGCGYAMSQSGQARENALATLLDATEPTSHSAHTLYTSLSQADTLATTSFIQPGLQTAESHREYLGTVDKAILAADEVLRGSVEAAASGADGRDAEVQELVRDIQRRLPQYTALMERAQANQRVGNPLGIAYMTQASTMMREDMLVKAERILVITRSQVEDDMRSLARPQIIPLTGLFAAVAALVAAQWILWRMFRRRLNRGFLAATGLMLAAIIWVVSANYGAWIAGTRGFESASGPFEELTSARIAAQETRTDETLTLLTRRTDERSGSTMKETSDQVTRALETVDNEPSLNDAAPLSADASAALTDWRLAHARMMNNLQSGDYEAAVALAASTSEEGVPSAAVAFKRLDSALARLISLSREEIRMNIAGGLNASDAVAPGVMVLSILATICTWVGVRPRMQEYL